MNYEELKQQVYKLSEINQRILFYHLVAWFEASPKNEEFIRALDSLLKSEFSEGVKDGEKSNISIVVVSGKDSLTRLDILSLIKSENIAIISSSEIPNLQSTETEHGFKNNRKNKFPPIQKTIRKV